MLQKIKSKYFIRRLFVLADEKNKLDIIKYNKNMKSILDISLINFKFFSKRYIIFEKNGKGKEYDIFGHLEFEGEYLNGKRNGKGKEYGSWSSKLKFEGEYLNGKRNGKGKEFDPDGNVLFAGEYLKGEKWKWI